MRHTRGFTLIEIMIALFVLGIGLLGVAGLQSASTSMNQQSALRTHATNLARDIADRMRANQTGVQDSSYDMGDGASPTQNGACESTTGCDPTALAGHDLWEWTRSVSAKLPQPPGAAGPAERAVVCRDVSPNDGSPGSPGCDGGANANYVVKIWWFDKEGETPAGDPRGDTERFVTEFQP